MLLLVSGELVARPTRAEATIAAHFAVLQTPALLFVDNFKLGFGVVPPVWTLSVEVGFYIVLPLVAARYFRHPLVGLVGGGGDRPGLDGSWPTTPDSVASLFGADLSAGAARADRKLLRESVPELDVGARDGNDRRLGICEAAGPVRRPSGSKGSRFGDTASRVPCSLVLIYLAGHGAVHDVSPFEGLFARESLVVTLGYPLALGAVLVGFTLIPAAGPAAMLRRRSIRWIGDISYAIYLIHFAVIWVALQEFSLPGRRKRRCGAGVVRDRVSGVDHLRLPVRPLPRAAGEALGASLRAPRPGSVRRKRGRWSRLGPLSRHREPVTPRHPSRSSLATHNRRDWLRLAMDSVLAQDYHGSRAPGDG